MGRTRSVVLASLLSLHATAAFAGAWVQDAGRGLFIAQAGYFSTDEYFDADGALAPQDRFQKWELQPYVEYGLKSWLTVGGDASLQYVGQSGDHNAGLGDPELFARARLWQGKRQVISIQPLIKLPSMYISNGEPRGASRSTDMEFSLLYGRNPNWFGHDDYTDARIGYRWRGRGLYPQWRADFAYGTYVTDALQLIAAGRSVMAAKLDENAAFREDGEQNYDLIKAECTAAYHLDEKRWVQLTAFQHVAGFQAGAGRGIAIGYAEGF